MGLIGTQATIRSGAYERRIAQGAPQIRVMAAACPLFVPLVENGRFRRGDIVAETVVGEYLEPFRAAGVDTLVLGCTHYPLLAELIGDYMGPEVTLIDVGRTCADAVAGRLADLDALSGAGRTGGEPLLRQRQRRGLLPPGLGVPAAGRGGVGDPGGDLEVLTEKRAEPRRKCKIVEGASLHRDTLII